MNVMNSLTIRSLKLNKKRTIVTIIGIILSGAMICGVAAIAESVQDLLVRSAKITDGNFHATFYDVNYENINYITDNPNVSEAMLSRNLGFAIFNESQDEAKPYLFIKEYDGRSCMNMPITLKEGRLPREHGEIVISENASLMGGEAYGIGSRIELDIGDRTDGGVIRIYEGLSETEELVPSVTRAFTITGIIEKPHFEGYFFPAYTCVAYLEESELEEFEQVNVSVLLKKPRKVFEIIPDIAQKAGDVGFSYNNELLRWLGISQSSRANNMLTSVALIIISLVVVGSVAVIYNAFAISVNERKKQIGMLASVGATPRQIRRSVFFEGLALGLIGIPIGILSGIAGISVTLGIVNDLLGNITVSADARLRTVVSYEVIVVTVFFVALVIFLSAWFPARRASRVSPIDAVRLSHDIRIKARKLRVSRLTRLLFGIEGEIALKNLKRNRKRYRATVFSLFISIVLFVSFSSFMKYGFISGGIYFADISYDIKVQKYELPYEELMEFYRDVASIEGVDRIAVIKDILGMVHGLERSKFGNYIRDQIDKGIYDYPEDENGRYSASFAIAAIGDAEFMAYAQENKLDINDYMDTENYRGILVNKNVLRGTQLAEYEPMNIKKGERIKFTEWKWGEAHDPVSLDIEIGAVTGVFPFGTEDSTIERQPSIIVSDSVFESILQKLHEESLNWTRQRTSARIKAGNSEKVAQEISSLHRRKYFDSAFYLSDISASREEGRRMSTIIAIFLYGFVSLIALIGATNIFNTISTNIVLRRREFAMLKSVGMTPAGFNKTTRYESIFYGLKALAYGLPVSVLISQLMHRAFGKMFDFAFSLPWKEMAICVIGVFAIVFITMRYSVSRIKRENIIDALKAENL